MSYFGFALLLLLMALGACSPNPPTRTSPALANPTPFRLSTRTPPPLNDPDLLKVKELLKKGMEGQDASALEQVISFGKWTASIYRQGGTPPIDPRRGLNLSLQFAKENQLVVDTERPTYEPNWSAPGGDTAVLVRVQPASGEPYYAHLYIDREPSAWRFTGILTRLPYYDAPSIAAVRAAPDKYDGKEFMYVGRVVPPRSAPASAGSPPANPAFVLDTFSGPIWVTMLDAPYVQPIPNALLQEPGQLARVFGTVRLERGSPILQADSVQQVPAGKWEHLRGAVTSVDPEARLVTLRTDAGQDEQFRLAETTPVFLANGQSGTAADIQAGVTVDVTGVPTGGNALLAEEVFLRGAP